MRKTLSLLLALLMCVGLLAGCAKEEAPGVPDQPSAGGETTPEPEKKPDPAKPEPEKKPAELKTLKLLRSGEDTVLTPHDAYDMANGVLMEYLTASLYVSVPAEDGTKVSVIPCYADGNPTSEDGMTWTIKLRQDAHWPDGQKITADDWLYSWKMAIDPNLMYGTGSGISKDSVMEIENAYEYYVSVMEKNGVKWEDVGLKKIDDYTVQVKTTFRVTPAVVIERFRSRALGLVRKEIYEQCISEDKKTCTYGTSQDKVMFCGPYMLKKWLKGTECTVMKNPEYPLADRVHVDEIYTRVVSDESTRLEIFERGDCDYVDLGTNGFAKYGEDPRVRPFYSKTIHTLEINQNHPDKPYMKDPIFRKAIFYGIDRTAIGKLTNMKPAAYFFSTEGQIFSDGTMWRNYGPAQELIPENNGYDPELANKYLDEAFQKYGLTQVELQIAYNEDKEARRAASEYIQASFANVFGGKVKVTLQAMSKAAMYKMMRTSTQGPVSTWDMGWTGWGEVDTPSSKAVCYTSDFSRRYTNYTNYKLDELVKVSSEEQYRLDEQKMADLTIEMEKSLYEDATCIPVIQNQNFAMFSDRVVPGMKVHVPNMNWGMMWSDIK